MSVEERIALTLRELAEHLGVSCRLIQREVAAGTFPIPSRLVGNKRLFSLKRVEEWLSEEGDL